MQCTVDDCKEPAAHRYTWAWGEEGACCDAHRTALESKSMQLGRTIAFAQTSPNTDRPGPRRPPYNTPSLSNLPAELGHARMALALEQEKTKQLEEIIVERDLKIAELVIELRKARTLGGPDSESVIEGETPPATK